MPNDPLIFELTGFIARRQGRWEESTTALERALELDPRNLFFLQQLSFTYEYQRRYRDLAATLDRALNLVPFDPDTRVARASIDLAERADPRPAHTTIEAVVAEVPRLPKPLPNDGSTSPCASATTSVFLARSPIFLLRELLLAAFGGLAFILRPWLLDARGDAAVTRAAFTAARAEVEKTMRVNPITPKGSPPSA